MGFRIAPISLFVADAAHKQGQTKILVDQKRRNMGRLQEWQRIPL